MLFSESGRLAGVEVMPAGLSDEEAIATANVLLAKRKGPFDSFEVWEGPASSTGSPCLLRRPVPISRGAAAQWR